MNANRMVRIVGSFLLSCIIASGCGSAKSDPLAGPVGAALGDNALNVTASDLRTMPNPRGQGTLVYVEQTEFNGVERKLAWLVLDGTAYALNGAAKDITPTLAWPREAEGNTWSATGLDQYTATEALEIIFEER